MTQLLSADAVITDRACYDREAPALRARLRETRRTRRVSVGDMIALEFENAETLQYQVQEMAHAEGLTDASAVAHEIEAYSRLLPTSHQLVATMFVELDDRHAVRQELDRLTGVQHALALVVDGRLAPGQEVPGPDEDGPSMATVSVHFLRFTLDDAQRDAFRDPAVPVSVVVDHPAYSESVPLAAATRLSLLADLALPA